jgi:hypothetical protein
MPLGKIAEDVINPHLGSGVKRVRKNLGQEKDVHGLEAI